MNIFGKLAVSALALSIASAASAASISGSTDFRVTLPEVLVLYHWDDAHLVLNDMESTAGNDSDYFEVSDSTSRELSTASVTDSYTIDGDVDTSQPNEIASARDAVTVTLQNSWAVRSLSSAPVSLALTNPNDILKNVNNNSSTITTSEAVLASKGSRVTGSNGTTISIPSGFKPVLGDIVFNLNLSSANHSGEYNTRGTAGAATDTDEGTDTFLLTLTGNEPANPSQP